MSVLESRAMMSLGLAHTLLPGSQLFGDPDTPLWRVHTDTRSLAAGDLFVALKGERFDAHAFLPQAAAQGASAVLVQRDADAAGLPGLLVADTRVALGHLAKAWRARFDIPLIAVTGSNGKTTVTQMLAAILQTWMRSCGHEHGAWATRGNFNNDIGVPLTLLGLREGVHRCAVVELGMNHPGEIAHLAALAQPTVALVNNAQREHQEFMQSVRAVALENAQVLSALPATGVAVFPADDEHAGLWRELAGQHQVCDFASETSAAVTGQASWQIDPEPHWLVSLDTPQGQAQLRLAMAGWHNVRNALAATAAALAAGLELSVAIAGLESFKPVRGRSQLRPAQWRGSQALLIDDSYNANPDSVCAAIDMLADLPGPHWLLLGDMGEVGALGPQFHQEAGEHARKRGIEHVWTAGPLSVHAQHAWGGGNDGHFPDAAAIVAAIARGEGHPAASILVKGSRFMKMEQIVDAITGVPHAA